MGFLYLLPVFQFCCAFLVLADVSPFAAALGGDIANSSTVSPPSEDSESSATSRTTPFKPGIAIIVGVLTTIFSITFLVLLYVKHCKRETYVNGSRAHPPSRSHSGINRKVVESLPMFRFSSLRGQKDGLECAVCLNKFGPEEVLRLLPKCKHAFHVECVDTWLDAHSTCPLCRYKVDPEDVLLLVDLADSRTLFANHETPLQSGNQGKLSSSPGGSIGNSRISGRHSSAAERGRSMEVIVEHPGDDLRGRVSLDGWKSRKKRKNEAEQRHPIRRTVSEVGKAAENPVRRSFDSWRSFGRKPGPESRKDGQLLVAQNGENKQHRLEHRIIISEAAEQQRWSDVHASDMLYLRSEMILRRDEEEGSGRGVIKERSVSEITGVSRYRSNGKEREEEGVVKRWLAWISESPQYRHHGKEKTAAISSSSSSSLSRPPSIDAAV